MFVLGNEPFEISDLNSSIAIHNFTYNPIADFSLYVSPQELEMLDLNPDELLQLFGNNHNTTNSSSGIMNNDFGVDYDYNYIIEDDNLHYENDFGETSPLSSTMSFTGELPITNPRRRGFLTYINSSSTESLNSVSTLDTDSITTFSTDNNANNSAEIRNDTMQNESVEENEIQVSQTDSDESEIDWMGSFPSSDGEDDFSNNSISSSSYHTSTTESISNQSEDHSDGFAQTIISYFNDSNSYSVCSDSDTSSSL